MNVLSSVESIYDRIASDPRFEGYRASKANLVQGKGSMNPRIIFVGEAPGRMENARQEPFVGKAGQQLKRLMAHSNIDVKDVYFTNVLKYWPHVEYSTRTPTKAEITDFREYLLEELDLLALQDTIIGLCGRVALGAIFPEETSINHIHGTRLYHNDMSFVPVYHPAVLEYRSYPFMKVLADYKLIGELAYADEQ